MVDKGEIGASVNVMECYTHWHLPCTILLSHFGKLAANALQVLEYGRLSWAVEHFEEVLHQ